MLNTRGKSSASAFEGYETTDCKKEIAYTI